MTDDVIDCAIIGGGPAGLTAATYLARFRQRALVFDDGGSRALLIPRTRNVPGFPEGIAGAELHARMVRQAETYGGEIVRGTITAISREESEFVLRQGQRTYRAQAVILATGVTVCDPPVDDLRGAIAAGAVRYCPVCDGFEVRDKRIAVLGAKSSSVEEAIFLSDYSPHVTLISSSGDFAFSQEQAEAVRQRGIVLEHRRPRTLSLADSKLEVVYQDGEAARFDTLYPCLGNSPRSELAKSLGADVSPTGGLLVDSRQQTNVPMLYAAGDVLEGLDQISSGCGQAAIAATTVHNHLRRR